MTSASISKGTRQRDRRPDPTVAEYLTSWLDEIVKPFWAPLTYEALVRVHVIPALEAKNLARLQVRDVPQWINELATICRCCAQGKGAPPPADPATSP